MNDLNYFFEKSISLKSIGVNNIALLKKDALEMLETVKSLEIPVLGGDVCEFFNGNLEYNYDNWYCNKEANESYKNFVERSVKKAKEYIKDYSIPNNKDVYFSIVLDIK